MTEQLLKTMISIVDATMESYKSDFYKYDLKVLTENYDTPDFIWCVRPSGSNVVTINVEQRLKDLRENEFSRFGVWNNPRLIEDFMCYHGRERFTKLYWYHNEKLEQLQNYHAVVDILTPMAEAIKNLIKTEFADEIPHYGKRMPVKFSSKNIRNQFMELARSSEGSELLKVVSRFHNYSRSAINEYITIGSDFAKKSFSFWHTINEKVRLNGGIIYYDNSWHIHT